MNQIGEGVSPGGGGGGGGFDRLPPHSIDAEVCLLASMMLDKEVIGTAVQLVNRDAFYQADHQIIFDALLKLYEQNRPVDAVILREELVKRGQLDEVGGTAYLGQILSSVPSSAHGMHYASIVREKALLRQLISASNENLRDAYSPHETAEIVLDKAEKRIFEIAEKKVSGSSAPLGEVAAQVYDMLEDRSRTGIMTGFFELDDMLNGLQKGEMLIVAARPSMGKAQPLDAKVLTTTGFKPMGELRVGDEVASVDGAPSRVTGVYPQGERQVYRVTLSDGRSAECCAEHLWRVHYRGWEAPRVVTTARLMELLTRKRYQGRVWVDAFVGVFGRDDTLPVDPWLLGFLLGDGCLTGTSLRFSTGSTEILERVESVLGAELGDGFAVTRSDGDAGYDYRISRVGGGSVKGVQGAVANPLTTALRSLGLWERNAETKFIPPAYLSADRAARARLLSGLIDADGWVETFGAVRLATASKRLADEVVFLTRSLGGTASHFPKRTTYTHRGVKRRGRVSHVCNLQLPADVLDLIPAKQARLKPRERSRRLNIVSVVPTRVTQTQCISVSHPSRLYITDDFVVTHNTAFAMNLVENIASGLANDGMVPCGVFSLEMSRQQLAQRMLCSLTGIDGHKVRKGMMNTEEFQRMAQLVAQLQKVPIYIDDSSQLTILEFRAKARRMKLQHDIKLLMIDYLQLMDNPGVESRQQQISEISRGIKSVARELEVPVICLSQLNRASEGRDGHRPRMSDLRESGSIEQDADVVMLLHREDYYRLQDPDFQPDNIAEVIIAKQRNGPTGTVKLTFDNKTTRFKNMAEGGGEVF